MKYTVSIDINHPIDRVIELFDNEENMFDWMEGLESFERLSGEPGEPGAKSKLRFKTKKREIEMVETIEEKNLPLSYKMTYEAKGVLNRINNRFESIDKNTTRYSTDQEFEFKGALKLMAFLMPGAFKKQSKKYLNDFKQFAESQN